MSETPFFTIVVHTLLRMLPRYLLAFIRLEIFITVLGLYVS